MKRDFHLNLRDLLRHTVAVRNRITHFNFPREISVRGCLQPAGRPFGILIQPVPEKFPRPIKLEQTGISADTRETTRMKMVQVHGLDLKITYRTLEFTNLPSISQQSNFLG